MTRMLASLDRFAAFGARYNLALCVAAAAFALAGCGGDEGGVAVPADVDCNAIIPAGQDGASLAQALASAKAGDCVVLEGASYQGSFVVPAGVRVVAAENALPEIEGPAGATTVTMKPHAGTLLRGVVVVGGKIGVLIDGTEGSLYDVAVMNAKDVAVAAIRDVSLGGPDTMPEAGIALSNVDLHASGSGLYAKNVKIALEGGAIHDNTGMSLTSGIGMAVLGGTQLVATGTSFQANGYGIVIDGAQTTAKLVDVEVLEQTERGIWAQLLAGNPAAPALLVEGSNTKIENNALTGIGAVQSSGIVVSSARVAGTIAKPIVSDLGTTVEIGDGIGLFDGTGDVTIDGVVLENNARAQAIVDGVAAGVSFVNPTVKPGGGQLGVVVQNTEAMVDVPNDVLSVPEQPLELSAPVVPLADP